jgi:hypothetical protein
VGHEREGGMTHAGKLLAENTLANWREQKEHLSKEKEKEKSLMQMQGHRLAVIFPSDTNLENGEIAKP